MSHDLGILDITKNSSHLVDHIHTDHGIFHGWVMWNMGTWLMTHVQHEKLMIVLWFQLGTSLSTLLEPPGRRLAGRLTQGKMRKQSACVPLGTNEITTWPEMGGALFILKSESQIPPFDGLSISILSGWIWMDLGSPVSMRCYDFLWVADSGSNVAPCQCFLSQSTAILFI